MTEEIFVSDGRLEAKVVSTTQNDKGWYVRLFLHPNDAAEVTKLRYGAVLDIRWREVLNVEVEPIEIGVTPRPLVGSTGEASLANEPGNRGTAGTLPKPKQRFADMPLSQQCALTCDDVNFRAFIARREPELFEIANGDAASVVRSVCNIDSRAQLDRDKDAAGSWVTLAEAYQGWLTDQKYGSARR